MRKFSRNSSVLLIRSERPLTGFPYVCNMGHLLISKAVPSRKLFLAPWADPTAVPIPSANGCEQNACLWSVLCGPQMSEMRTHHSDRGSMSRRGSAVLNPVCSFIGLMAANSAFVFRSMKRLTKITLNSGRAGNMSLMDSPSPAEALSSKCRDAVIIVMIGVKPKSY